MAPDEVHTAVRRCVTVLPGPLEVVGGAVRPFLRVDSLAKRPRADAMFPAFDAAAMRKTEAILGVEEATAPPCAAGTTRRLLLHYN